uniref:Uncharacterized protein n=1 Tax=viral metagenome TaxID=1070528 RepID=A0A6C0K5W2_9ZZZZ
METNNIKTLTITGSAAANPLTLDPVKKSPRRKSVSKLALAPSPEPSDSSEPSETTQSVVSTKYTITKAPLQSISPTSIQRPPVQAPVQAPVQPGGQKVILNPQKPRVKLLSTSSQPAATAGRIKSSTRKIRRVSIPNPNRKITRAHKTSLETKQTPLDSIRSFLVGKGVIQEKSKAPEKMLRSMYNDFALLKTNAL